MKWLEISVQVESEDASRAVRELFDLYGQGGAVQEQLFLDHNQTVTHAPPIFTVKTYLSLDDDGQRRHTLEGELSKLAEVCAIGPAQFKELEDTDWSNAWRIPHQPQRIGQRFVLKLPEHDYSPAEDDIVVDLEPGMAFGTGLHATTRMCLVCLEELVTPGDRLVDMGTGSGVLSIAAAKLGAASILALDNDSTAVKVARENVALNIVTGTVQIEEGSLEHLAGLQIPPLEGIMVNIIAEVIVDMMKSGLTAFLKPGGWLVASGILAPMERSVRSVFADCGVQITARYEDDGWVTLTGAKGTTGSPSPTRREET